MNAPVLLTYDDLRAAIAARRQQLGLTQRAFDEIAGVPLGYTGKLECGMRNFGPMSLECILAALGVGLVLTPLTCSDTESETWACVKALQKKNGAKGGRARARNLTRDQRRAAARHAVKSRWRNWRAMRAAKQAKERRK